MAPGTERLTDAWVGFGRAWMPERLRAQQHQASREPACWLQHGAAAVRTRQPGQSAAAQSKQAVIRRTVTGTGLPADWPHGRRIANTAPPSASASGVRKGRGPGQQGQGDDGMVAGRDLEEMEG
ncbi:MAG: hypothetical protein M1832_004232 [Thelocarpon impressellum]|nr:MAG: hypothetical protein M1832_004232 [Thelocarpon impressellum]